MNKLHISPEAELDLREIRKYIALDLANPSAAANTIQNYLHALRQLEHDAQIGATLGRIVGFETPYRFLVNGSYLVFYFAEGNDVYINRVLYGRRDYTKILFRDIP